MPFSGKEFEGALSKLVASLQPKTVLDVGVGAGKIGSIVIAAHPAAEVYGIEIEPSYKQRFAQAWGKYKDVFIGGATPMSLAHSRMRPDLTVFGDVLEHLWAHEAACLLEFWCIRSKYVVAIWPTGYSQDDAGGVQAEIHRCELQLSDLTARRVELVRYHRVARQAEGQHKHFAVFRGKLAGKDTVQSGVAY